MATISSVHVLILALTSWCVLADDTPQGTVMHEWVSIDYDWPSADMKAEYIRTGQFIPERCTLSAVETYKGNVYVTIPRMKFANGVPSTLNVIVNVNGTDLLRPYPSWEAQKIGDCSALQLAMSMEVDPQTGYMYVIDPGRTAVFADPGVVDPSDVISCPAKIVVYDLKDGSVVRLHELPDDIVPKATNFLNDIVLDRVTGPSSPVQYAYITDTVLSKIYSFDLTTNVTTSFSHPSFHAESGPGADIVINDVHYKMDANINGIALSPDFHYVYYSAISSLKLYQLEAQALRRNSSVDLAATVRSVGEKVSQSDALAGGTSSIFYGAFHEDAVYRWDVAAAQETQGVDEGHVQLLVQEKLVQDHQRVQWPDSMTIDQDGYLWFSASKAQLWHNGGIDWSGNDGANSRVYRVNVGERSYIDPRGPLIAPVG